MFQVFFGLNVLLKERENALIFGLKFRETKYWPSNIRTTTTSTKCILINIQTVCKQTAERMLSNWRQTETALPQNTVIITKLNENFGQTEADSEFHGNGNGTAWHGKVKTNGNKTAPNTIKLKTHSLSLYLWEFRRSERIKTAPQCCWFRAIEVLCTDTTDVYAIWAEALYKQSKAREPFRWTCMFSLCHKALKPALKFRFILCRHFHIVESRLCSVLVELLLLLFFLATSLLLLFRSFAIHISRGSSSFIFHLISFHSFSFIEISIEVEPFFWLKTSAAQRTHSLPWNPKQFHFALEAILDVIVCLFLFACSVCVCLPLPLPVSVMKIYSFVSLPLLCQQ